MARPTAARGRGWELRGHLPEPVERAGRAPPGLAAIPRVLGRLVPVPRAPQRLGEPGAGAHVGPGLEEAPEVADILLEGLRPEGELAGLDAAGVERLGLLHAPGAFLGEQDVGVGAERR